MIESWQYCDLIYVIKQDKIIKARITGISVGKSRIYYSPCSNHKLEYCISNENCFNTEAEALLYLKSEKEEDLALTIKEIDKHTASKLELEKQISDIEDRITELGLCIN